MQDALAVARQKWEGDNQKDREHEQAMLDSQKALELAQLTAQMQQAQKEAELQQAVLEKRIAEQNAAELQQKMHDREEAELKLQVRSGNCHVCFTVGENQQVQTKIIGKECWEANCCKAATKDVGQTGGRTQLSSRGHQVCMPA